MATPILAEMDTPPIVGSFYRVPCVMIEWSGMRFVVVVHGSWHEDKKLIGFPHHHYHIDARFLADRYFAAMSHGRYGTSWPYAVAVTTGNMLGKVEVKRRKCRREFPPFPPEPLRDLRLAMAGTRIEDGRCPHRGYNLETVRHDPRGCVQCPLHGLKFNKRGVCLKGR